MSGKYLLTKKIVLLLLLLLSFLYSSAQEEDSVKMKVELGGVEIIGQRTPAVYNSPARTVTIISSEEIRAYPSATLQDLLEQLPFTDIRQRNIHGVQADASFRGGSFDQVMVLINGVNITDPQTGHFSLDLPFELGSVERIEVLHGSGSRLYGPNAYKGVINIITHKNQNSITGGFNYGQYELLHSFAEAGIKTGKLYNNISISKNKSGGYTENTDYDITNFFYRGGITGRLGEIDWQEGRGGKAFGANDFYSPSFPEEYEETTSKFGSIGFKTKGQIKISATAYWRRHDDHFLLKRYDPGFYQNYHQTNVYGLRTNVLLATILGNTSLGTDDRFENIISSSLGEELSLPVRVRNTDSAYYFRGYTRNTSGFFIEHSFVIDNFSVTGGFLADIYKEYQNSTVFFPGIDVSYRPLSDVKVFASLNKSLRLPTFTDMFYHDPANEGNKGLVPEKMVAFEAGIDVNSDGYSAGFTFFRDKGKDVIDWVWNTIDHKYHSMNIAEITTGGIELQAEKSFGNNGNFSLSKIRFSYAYTAIEKSSDYESKYSLDNLKHKLQLSLSDNITRRIKADLRINYYNRNGTFLDYNASEKVTFSRPFRPYWLMDAGISYSRERITLHCDISNLLNTKYTDIGNLFQPGRWITCGATVSFPLRGC